MLQHDTVDAAMNDIRRANLQLIVEAKNDSSGRGGRYWLAGRLGYRSGHPPKVNVGAISSVLTGRRGIRGDWARRVERALGLEVGWMDRDNNGEMPKIEDPGISIDEGSLPIAEQPKSVPFAAGADASLPLRISQRAAILQVSPPLAALAAIVNAVTAVAQASGDVAPTDAHIDAVLGTFKK